MKVDHFVWIIKGAHRASFSRPGGVYFLAPGEVSIVAADCGTALRTAERTYPGLEVRSIERGVLVNDVVVQS